MIRWLIFLLYFNFEVPEKIIYSSKCRDEIPELRTLVDDVISSHTD